MVSGMNLIEPLDCNDIIVGGMLHHHIRKKTTKKHTSSGQSELRHMVPVSMQS